MRSGLSQPRLSQTRLPTGLRRWLLTVLALAALLAACRGSEASPTPGVLERGIAAMEITSPAFQHGASIPLKHSCEGADISPLIYIGTPPPQTRSLALIMDDPDAPGGTFVHWVALNFDPGRHDLEEGLGKEGDKVAEGQHGVNGFGKVGYGGPCPPAGPAHTYRIMVYALDRELQLGAGATVTELLTAMRSNVLGLGQLEGTFARVE